MVKAKDLSIYDNPVRDVEYVLQPEKESPLQNGISVVRKKTWEVTDRFQGMVQSTKNAYKTVERTANDVVAFIKTEEGFYPRAGVISLAGLAGIVLARKGGIVKKVLYSGVLVSAAASICYPYQAVRLAEKEWDWIKTHSIELLKPSDNKEESKPKELEETKQGSKLTDVKEVSKSEQAPRDNDATNKDYGQSNPADKDLYTTRS
ncbi:MICOS complex subunit MIC27-like [Antedon mediterranea]|uniref:MICOS complex subunit MIC27-like n=1 Tax=Antedon mediterranea TaxID=105859 RepID=UPI003AF9D34A